ncbi:MAG TPA: FAD binding domain-containing protein [Pyrinomonadaceae bacterium]|nr:FAD binding domain-containing protein [Pyrinomonadaceae bacterium]
MIEFILNDQNISTDLASGTTVLDFVRYRQNLKGTKIGCREGDCGACTILVGELRGEIVNYRTMTSCLMPLANAAGKHIVSIEGINPEDGSMTPVQRAMVDESGTQCGFCTVGFVMSLTGFCIDNTKKTPEMAVSAVDGNICRCTGYKSIERAAHYLAALNSQLNIASRSHEGGLGSASTGAQLNSAIEKNIVPTYFENIGARLTQLKTAAAQPNEGQTIFVSGGTDVYVQRPDAMAEAAADNLFYNEDLRGIRDTGEFIEMGASVTVTDLLESPVMQSIFPDLYKHLKLVSSTPIRNMATLAGNFVNASPIGDMTVWFLALDAEIELCKSPHIRKGETRNMALKDLYLGYKQLAKTDDEYISSIRFRKPAGDFRFNFEKVCKRTYLDIATVNTAISLAVDSLPGPGWLPPVLTEQQAAASGSSVSKIDYTITAAHVAAGGVAPVPLYLKKTSEFLRDKEVTEETIAQANEIMQSEISPISDVRGTESYKRLLLRQLLTAHFVELFGFVDDLLS